MKGSQNKLQYGAGQMHPRRSSIHLLLGMILIPIGVLLSSQVQAQIKVVAGSGPPSKRLKADWYMDTLSHAAWRAAHRTWSLACSTGVRAILPCHGFVHVQNDGLSTIWDATGKVATDYRHCACSDSMRVVAFAGISIFYRPDGTELHRTHCGADWRYNDTIGGMRCYCVPLQEATGNPMLDCEEIHAWGMLGNGRWLIQPIYDAPFHFQNGIAEVYYYGQKFKINEQGERLK